MPLVALALHAGLLLAVPSAQVEARATPIAFDLSRGLGAEPCLDRDALAARVEERLSRTGTARVPVADRVTITVERTAEGYVGLISAIGFEGGTRRLLDASPDCAGLAEALTLTLSMIADGRPPLSSKVEAAVLRPARPWELGAAAVGSTGILGTPSAGLSLDVVWHPWPRLATGLSALWMPSRTFDNATGKASFTVVAGTARVCGGILPFGGTVFPAVCTETAAGALRGVGEGYADARSIWVPWFVAGGSLQVGLRLRRSFSLAARAGYLFSLRTETFSVGGVGPVYESGHPGWTAGLAALVRIP